MDVQLLGPVRAFAGAVPLDLGPPRQRAVLAALAVDAGRCVPTGVLVDRIWDERPPQDPRGVLYAYLSRLRRTLGEAGPVRDRGGYRLAVDPDQVDLHRSRGLTRSAGTGGPADRVRMLGAALALWRGIPLADLEGPWVTRTRATWQQEQLDLVVGWGDAALAADRPEQVIATVRPLLAEHPLDEALVGLLMRAQAAAGRRAAALETYAAARRQLAEELGADVGPRLRRLHQALLRGDPPAPGPGGGSGPRPGPAAGAGAGPGPRPGPGSGSGPGRGPGGGSGPGWGPGGGPGPGRGGGSVPAQLPADVPAFTGREADLRRLDGVLAGSGRCVPVAVVSGPAGVGKTALAVHWAHRVADRFPDGQLHVDLRGYDPAEPVTPDRALARFLRALGVADREIPDDPDESAARYRSALAGRRALIVLDNARDVAQVRPLLPGVAGSAVVVTSRDSLAGLVAVHGATRVDVDLLSRDAAVALLRALVGDRVDAEPEAARRLADRCGRLPLALRIAAELAAGRPAVRLAELAADLDDRRRLDLLDAGGDPRAAMRAVFSWSLTSLPDPAAELFRLLGVHPGPAVSEPAAASLAGRPAAEVRPLLSALVRAHLLVETEPGRYEQHDLLRAYAERLVGTVDPPAIRAAAEHRAVDHYALMARAASLQLDPARDPIPADPPVAGVTLEPPADAPAALSWLTTELSVLTRVRDRAAVAGLDRRAWQLAWALDDVLDRVGDWSGRAANATAGLAAARRSGEPPVRAHAHRLLGLASSRVGRPGPARQHLRAAARLAERAGDPAGAAHAHLALALVLERDGRLDDALTHARQAVGRYRRAGHRDGEANARNEAGWLLSLLGQDDAALAECTAALAVLTRLGDRAGQAATLDSLGHAYHQLGRWPEAVAHYQRSVVLFDEVGNRASTAETLERLAGSQRAAGDEAGAAGSARRARELLGPPGGPGSGARGRRGSVRTGPGQRREKLIPAGRPYKPSWRDRGAKSG